MTTHEDHSPTSVNVVNNATYTMPGVMLGTPPALKDKNATVEDAKTQSLLSKCPKQQKLHVNLNLIKQHRLPLKTQIRFNNIEGLFLLTGPVSSGKSSAAARVADCDAFAYSQNLSTR